MDAYLYVRTNAGLRLLFSPEGFQAFGLASGPVATEADFLAVADLASRVVRDHYGALGFRAEYWLAIFRGWTVEYIRLPLTPPPAPGGPEVDPDWN